MAFLLVFFQNRFYFKVKFRVKAAEPFGNVLMDGFGVVAMVAMTPLVAIQILGAVYAIKSKRAKEEEAEELAEFYGDIEEEIEEYQLDLKYSIIELDYNR